MKYIYAPGLPGYGTQGADGSNGLLGISTYFSEFDGAVDTTQLSIKIANNQILFQSADYIPGYPDRKYQTGDLFVDVNGRVYEIDLNATLLYSTTGSRLNTSTIFVEGTETESLPEFIRYSNSYSTEKFLVDNVYVSGTINNYALSPQSGNGIYGIGAVDYAQIKYVDNSIGVNDNYYHPYSIWSNTNDIAKPEGAIALVKEHSNISHWRLGNTTDTGLVRDVSLTLDFKHVNIIGDSYINNDLIINNDLSVINNAVFDNNINVSNTAIITNAYITADVSVDGNIILEGDLKSSISGNLDINFISESTIARSINITSSGSGSVFSTEGAGGDILITSGSAANRSVIGTAKKSGAVTLIAGNGGSVYSNADTGGGTGTISLLGGIGGYAYADDSSAGKGSDIDIIAGPGGDSIGSNTYVGSGGDINIVSGAGGDGNTQESASKAGDINILTGITNDADNVANININAGDGFINIDGDKGVYIDSNGGDIYLEDVTKADKYIDEANYSIDVSVSSSTTNTPLKRRFLNYRLINDYEGTKIYNIDLTNFTLSNIPFEVDIMLEAIEDSGNPMNINIKSGTTTIYQWSSSLVGTRHYHAKLIWNGGSPSGVINGWYVVSTSDTLIDPNSFKETV